jgi:hypothetical protein
MKTNMISTSSAVVRVVSACVLATGLGLVAPLWGEPLAAPVRFTALAVNMGHPGPTGAGTVEIVVNRLSSDAERDRLLSVLLEKGPEKLLDVLRDLPRVGYIRTPNSIGYNLRFARRAPSEDGGERYILATDRYISFWEARERPRSIDYPFTVIELRMNRNGEGEGKMSLATKITADKEQKLIVLENYATQPVLLQSVRREMKTAN